MQAANWACSHRKYFITKKGYIGVCAPNAKAGDLVCALHGGKSLYLLRSADIEPDDRAAGGPKQTLRQKLKHKLKLGKGKRIESNPPSKMDPSFQYVGECNIQGLSKQETFDELEHQNIPVQMFPLK
jgi:hypothetical protein